MSEKMERGDIAYHSTAREEGFNIPPDPPEKTPCQKCALSSCLLGFVFLAAGIVGAAVLKPYVKHKIVENMVLMEDGMAFLGWKDPPVTPLLSIYFFNLTNEERFLSGMEKAKVNKIGPYVYSQEIHKVDTEFGDNGETITYTDNKTYRFSRGLSAGDESDLILMPNIPLFGAFRKFDDSEVSGGLLGIIAKSIFSKNVFEHIVSSHHSFVDNVPFIKVSVNEFLWGYPSLLMAIKYAESDECRSKSKDEHKDDDDAYLEEMEWDNEFFVDETEDDCRNYENIQIPFGLFMGRNATVVAESERTLFTGKTNIAEKGLYKYAEGKDRLGSWAEERCNVVRGRDPGCLTINIDKNEMMTLYFQNLCRNIKLRYMSTVQYAGVQTLRFSPVEETFNSPWESPENSCYCHSGNCPPSGVFDLGVGCKPLSPVYMSWPHFLHGDPKLRHNIEGVEPPNQTEHSFQLDIEPEWGITLAVRARFQMNVKVKRNGFSWFENVKEPVILPFLYIDEGIEGPNKVMLYNINILLNIADKVKGMAALGGIFIGGLCMIPEIVFWAKSCCSKSSSPPL